MTSPASSPCNEAACAQGADDLRRLVFPKASRAGTQVSAWLLAEARAVGDSEAIELSRKNCRLRLATRTGACVEPVARTS